MNATITLRRSLLYVPGDKPAMLTKAPSRGADGLILNLEDAVAPANKPLARQAVTDALRTLNFGRTEAIVRINPPDTDAGYRDLLAVTPLAPAAVLLPKASSVEGVRFVAWTIERLEVLHGLPVGQIKLMCMIESAAGVLNAVEIAACHPRVAALIFGAADFSMEVGCTITEDGRSLLAAASRIILSAQRSGHRSDRYAIHEAGRSGGVGARLAGWRASWASTASRPSTRRRSARSTPPSHRQPSRWTGRAACWH